MDHSTKYLYAVGTDLRFVVNDPAASTAIKSFAVGSDGKLTPLGGLGTMPVTTSGLAAW
jgi:hypothetical protein